MSLVSNNSGNSSSSISAIDSMMIEEVQEAPSRDNANNNNNKSKPIKRRALLAVSFALCTFSIFTSSVEKDKWKRGISLMEQLQVTLSSSSSSNTEGLQGNKTHNKNQNNANSRLQAAAAATARGRKRPSFIPLADYVPPTIPTECPFDLEPVPIVINQQADDPSSSSTSSHHQEDRKIPRIVHMTGKSPCLTRAFLESTKQWSFPNHSFYFHDDTAVDALFDRDWPMFPQLQNSMQCLKNAGGAAKADLWRYLVMWEYGGIYTDMDNLPGPLFNETTITPDMDAFFLQEGGGWISQYFFAVAPKHPIMFLAVQDVMREMHNLEDTGNFYVPQKTGPGATKRAFLAFMGINSQSQEKDIAFYSKPPAGLYYGKVHGNRTVTVEGSRRTSNDWVRRSAIGGRAKNEGWKKMNITNYQTLNKQPSNQSCIMQLHDYYAQQREIEETLRTRRW